MKLSQRYPSCTLAKHIGAPTLRLPTQSQPKVKWQIQTVSEIISVNCLREVIISEIRSLKCLFLSMNRTWPLVTPLAMAMTLSVAALSPAATRLAKGGYIRRVVLRKLVRVARKLEVFLSLQHKSILAVAAVEESSQLPSLVLRTANSSLFNTRLVLSSKSQHSQPCLHQVTKILLLVCQRHRTNNRHSARQYP